MCVMFQKCQKGQLAEVKEHISQLSQKKVSGRAKVTPMKAPTEDEKDGAEDEVCTADILSAG